MRNYFLWVVSTLAVVFVFTKFAPEFLSWLGVSLSEAKTISEIIQSLVQITAIIIAGVWTYERFIKNREDYPYPTIQHRIEHFELKNNLIYLSVFVTVTNEGKTKLDLEGGELSIRQVLPLTKETKEAITKSDEEEIRLGTSKILFVDSGRRIGWDTLGTRKWSRLRGGMRELEPGQTREIQFEFLIEDEVKVIEAISYIEYANSSWESATVYALTPSELSPKEVINANAKRRK